MKPQNIFYMSAAFALGGALVYSTLDYSKQAIVMLITAILSIGIGLFFKAYSK